jgi:phosphoserine aminotransferase
VGGFSRKDASTRSNTSVCLKVVDPWFTALPKDGASRGASKIASVLDKQGVALDIGGYRAAPPGLRIWCGATVDASDLEALTPWLDWAFQQVKNG